MCGNLVHIYYASSLRFFLNMSKIPQFKIKILLDRQEEQPEKLEKDPV